MHQEKTVAQDVGWTKKVAKCMSQHIVTHVEASRYVKGPWLPTLQSRAQGRLKVFQKLYQYCNSKHKYYHKIYLEWP